MRSVFFLVEWLCFVALVKGRLSPGSSLDSPGTSNDSRVATLLSIVGEFGFPRVFAQSWKGDDPCHNWIGISCIEGSIHDIVFVSMNLTGVISPKFADVKSLAVIDLSHNSLTGTIPVELATKLKKLETLDVSYNNLHGKLPTFRKGVINAEGNPQTETDSIHVSSKIGNKKKSIDVGLFIGSMVALVLAGGVGVSVFYAVMSLKRSMLTEPNEVVAAMGQQSNDDDEIVEADDNAIPFQILRDATDDFGDNNVIGSGGFGSVYKGILLDGTEVAVKRMKQSNAGKGIDEFKSEVSVLTKVHHRNLVVLHGYCLEGNERILVYQYMQQGTLSRHLFDWKDQGLKPLEWTRRLSIALDVARGLEYLHTLARQSQSYIHRDLKPSNILLGDDLQVKLSDFGLARSTAEGEESFRTAPIGTYGYLAPEYALTRRVTRKVDIYSFGVILMELLTGQKAIDEKRSEDDSHIVFWFRKMCLDKDSLANVIDETIEVKEETRDSINEVAELASHCCSRQPEQRPEMSHAVTVLASLTEQWKPNEIVEENIDAYLPEMLKQWQKDDLKESSNISVV